jgi:hypothetical protein
MWRFDPGLPLQFLTVNFQLYLPAALADEAADIECI